MSRGAREPRRSRRDAPDGAADAWVGGKRAVAEAIASGRAREVLVARGTARTPGLRDLHREAERAGIGVREAGRAELDAVAPDHQGVAAKVRGVVPMSERDLREHAFGDDDVVVVLDGITDPHNLGAAARTAEAAGVAMLVIRERRSAGPTPAAVRASAGALLHIPLAVVTNLTRALESLKRAGFTAVGLDASAPGDIYGAPAPDGRLAIVVGAEGVGISRLVRESCDVLVRLPMRGRVASLNASASLAAALYGYVLVRDLPAT